MKHILLLCLLKLSAAVWAQSHKPILDKLGRTLILHGLNTAGGAKHVEGHQPWITEQDVEREYRDFGFNTVRYLIFWGAIEPQQGVYDEAYLTEVKKRVEWYTSRGMYVILDMHQDVYGYGVGGNGAPEWACADAVIKNAVPDKWAWWLQNLEPKVVRSYLRFFRYQKHKELQEHYIQAWLRVISMFKDNPYVLGYDLMNEPHGGDIVRTLFGGFERRGLTRFYKRIIPAVRNSDADKYIFFEPRSFGVNFGMRSHLKQMKDQGADKLVYAPHLYMMFVDVGGDYKRKNRKGLLKWYKNRDKELAKHQTPMLIGEFGLSPSKKDFEKYLRDIFYQADTRHASWTYWSSDPGGWGPLDKEKNPSPILNELVQVFPQAVSGQLLSYHYNPEWKTFSMEYISDAAIQAPTVIAVPKQIYPDAYTLNISGAKNYTTHTDPLTNALVITVLDSCSKVRVDITPQ